jgi:ABC-2 type transport system ATP-binding protein
MPPLRVDHLSVRYEPPTRWLRPLVRTASRQAHEALRDVSLSVDAGEIVGLVGPNGAGKTTLIKVLSTLLAPTAGTATIAGYDTVRATRDVQRRIGAVLADDRGSYWRLNGRDNLELFGVLHGLTRDRARARAAELLEWVDLADDDRLVFGYSSGMRARLGLARAMLASPPVLVLDEPTRSLDPVATQRLLESLRGTAGTGTAILLSSHRLDEVAGLCDRTLVIVEGHIRAEVGRAEAADRAGLPAALVEMMEADGPA